MLLAWSDNEGFKTGPRTRGVLGRVPGSPINLEQYAKDIRESIHKILVTRKGERVMRPEFGCGIQDFIFEVMSPQTLRRMEESVWEALSLFEPRIELQQVEISDEETEEGNL